MTLSADDIRRLNLAAAGVLRPIGSVGNPRKQLDSVKLAKLLLEQKPDQASFDAVFEILRATPKQHQPYLLRIVFAARCHHWLFQAALLVIWTSGAGARAVEDAAGSRETLKAWFAHARFDWPCDELFAECVTVYGPRHMILFRGGRGDPGILAEGPCWTPLKPIAALYAVANPAPRLDSPGQPIIISTEVTRQQIALKMINGDQETVVLDNVPYKVDCTDEGELAELADEGRRLREKFYLQREAFIARQAARRSGNTAL